MIETMLLATGSHEPAPPIPKQIEYSAPGTYTVIVVAEMLPMHIVATGAGGGCGRVNGTDNTTSAAGGGGTCYKNNINPPIGSKLTIDVGAGGWSWGWGGHTSGNNGQMGGSSYVRLEVAGTPTTTIMTANGGGPGTYGGGAMAFGGAGGTCTGGDANNAGGSGGNCGTSQTLFPGGGGAGGYSGAGGKGHNTGYQILPPSGWTAGAGGGGAGSRDARTQKTGGGVGLRGEGASGSATIIEGSWKAGIPIVGAGASVGGDRGQHGGVRIIFGADRAFPNTNTDDIE